MVSYNRLPVILFLSLSLAILIQDHETKAQTIPDCATNLIPCADYLNSTKPPDSCCKPLRETVHNQRDCLCSFYNNPGLIQSFGINITQALQLPKYCGVTADTNLCSNVSAPAPASGGPGIIPGTPSTPGGVPGKDENSAGTMAWTGASGLLLFWVSILAY